MSRRTDFYAQASLPLNWVGEVPQRVNAREHSQLPRRHDAPMASQNVDADYLSRLTDDVMYLYPELSEMVRLGY
jgi:hypothetical protein